MLALHAPVMMKQVIRGSGHLDTLCSLTSIES